MSRKKQIMIVTAVWIGFLVAVAAVARMKSGLPRLTFLESGDAVAAEGCVDLVASPLAPTPQAGEAAVTSPPLPSSPDVMPEPPLAGELSAESTTSPIPPPPLDAKVARSAPSADLLPPVAPATVEPPVLETAAAKQPIREDNVWRGESLQAAPPRSPELALAHCLWSTVGKTKARPRTASAKNAGPFVGTFTATLDEQKGLVLPQKVSEQMGLPRHVYVTAGPEDCLWICNAAGLERLTATLAPDAGRLYFAQTTRLAVDRSGRLALPATLGPVACLHTDLVLLGVGDHFELWDVQRLQRYVDRRTTKK